MPDSELIALFFVFLITEFIEWTVLKHDGAGWHIRFFKQGNLLPVAKTWVVALIFFVIIFLVSDLILPNVYSSYIAPAIKGTAGTLFLLLGGVAFSYLWIWHHIVMKRWDNGQYLVAAVAVLSFGAYIFSLHLSAVNVTGNINTYGTGATVTKMIFLNGSGYEFPATLIKNNSYTIRLPNYDTYKILIYWSIPNTHKNGVQNGTLLPLYSTYNTTNFNTSIRTPYAQISLSGHANTGFFGFGTTSLNITFVASNGSTITSPVQNDEYKAVTLQNFGTYTVYIHYQRAMTLWGLLGPPIDKCTYIKSFTLNESVGINTTKQDFSC